MCSVQRQLFDYKLHVNARSSESPPAPPSWSPRPSLPVKGYNQWGYFRNDGVESGANVHLKTSSTPLKGILSCSVLYKMEVLRSHLEDLRPQVRRGGWESRGRGRRGSWRPLFWPTQCTTANLVVIFFWAICPFKAVLSLRGMKHSG